MTLGESNQTRNRALIPNYSSVTLHVRDIIISTTDHDLLQSIEGITPNGLHSEVRIPWSAPRYIEMYRWAAKYQIDRTITRHHPRLPELLHTLKLVDHDWPIATDSLIRSKIAHALHNFITSSKVKGYLMEMKDENGRKTLLWPDWTKEWLSEDWDGVIRPPPKAVMRPSGIRQGATRALTPET